MCACLALWWDHIYCLSVRGWSVDFTHGCLHVGWVNIWNARNTEPCFPGFSWPSLGISVHGTWPHVIVPGQVHIDGIWPRSCSPGGQEIQETSVTIPKRNIDMEVPRFSNIKKNEKLATSMFNNFLVGPQNYACLIFQLGTFVCHVLTSMFMKLGDQQTMPTFNPTVPS